MYSSKLSVGIHILCMIALTPGSTITSDRIAGSIQTNSALVRRLMSRLKKAKLIQSHTKLGAIGLLKPSSEISLLEIFHAVEPRRCLFDLHANTNPNCPVGAKIGGILTEIYGQMQNHLENELSGIFLSDIIRQI